MKQNSKQYQTPNIVDKGAGFVIYGFYSFLLVFFIISLLKPEWLVSAGKNERKLEAASIMNQAINAAQNGDHSRALELLTVAYKKAPEIPEIYVNMGLSFTTIGKPGDALKSFEKALLAGSTDSSNIYYMIAGIHDKTRNKLLSDFYFRKSIEVNQFNIDKSMKLGSYYLYNGKWDSSLSSLNKALELQSGLLEHFRNMALTAYYKIHDDSSLSKKVKSWLSSIDYNYNMNKYDTAIFSIQLNRDKRTAIIHNQIGFVLSKLGSDSLAYEHFLKAVNIWNDYPDANKNVEFIQKKLKKKSEE